MPPKNWLLRKTDKNCCCVSDLWHKTKAYEYLDIRQIFWISSPQIVDQSAKRNPGSDKRIPGLLSFAGGLKNGEFIQYIGTYLLFISGTTLKKSLHCFKYYIAQFSSGMHFENQLETIRFISLKILWFSDFLHGEKYSFFSFLCSIFWMNTFMTKFREKYLFCSFSSIAYFAC